MKRWDITAGLQGLRHTVLGNLFGQTEDALSASAAIASGDFASSTNVKQSGASATWSWRITPFDSSNFTVSYARSETPGLGREDNQKYQSLSLLHQFDPKMIGSLNFRRLQNDSNQAGAGYTENAVSANLQIRF